MKKIMLLLLLLSLSLLVSCSKEAPDRGVDINYKQGFTDITIASEANEEEYGEQPLQLPISVHNTLAYDIEDVTVSVKGFDKYYVELYNDQQQLGVLEGRSVFNHEGMKENFLFEGFIKRLLPGAEKEPEEFRVYVNYNSKIEFAPSLCVSSLQNNFVGSAYDTYQGACSFVKELSFDGQGAPLGVTGLEIIPRPGRQAEFRMTITNKGKGTVGQVSLASANLGGKPLTCEFRGETVQNSFFFDAEEKSTTLICNGYLASDEKYTTPLFVELLYEYELNQKESLMILE